ncbi:PhzF family phenazine biosynthesis protein [Paeniglutamicibacter cryotolerans]|uniref:Putative PhzF superfamily epimerase YddE/YHI9 n=1 Tax=Paeniglutamicibacter cryotolerans TaxID=670079 RepID=A0A839QET5_9MICC|nr:PhzF family phenazine biosynthesis protein [Paeniglutamicibacter cryotolerans]MBB2994420.1 putative PhzF superfamily epimerase YddE/YHI9 [Paeniglutamicibacter cryotolerans]
MSRAYKHVDVFTSIPYLGNALAVVLDGEGLDAATMAGIANWTNLAETAFLFPPTDPGADYKVRIFTTTTELPFAGHPTLGAAHAWLEAGGRPRNEGRIVQECGAGLIELRVQDSPVDGTSAQLAFKAPPLVRTGPLEDDVLEWAISGLGITARDVLAHQWLANGPTWAGLVLRDADLVLALEPDFATLAGLEVGVIGAYDSQGIASGTYGPKGSAPRAPGTIAELQPLNEEDTFRSTEHFRNVVSGAPADFEVRAFIAGEGLPEDPATGSLNAGFGIWLTEAGLAPDTYTVRQGTRLGRAARIDVLRDDSGVWICGDTVTCVDGFIYAG